MKKLLLLLFISTQSYGQVDVEYAQTNISEAALGFSSTTPNFVKNALFSDNGVEVKAVLTTSTTGAVYWRRSFGGATSSGIIYLNEPIYNGDLVVGNGGSQILVVFQGGNVGLEGIRYASYSFIGGIYSQTSVGNIATNFNLSGNGMLYGGPSLAIDQNDSVVVLYKSFNTSVVTSNEIHFFSRAGNLNGVWKNYANTFNAFIVDQGLSLPSQYDAMIGNVGITKYDTDNVVNFALPISNGGFSQLYLQQILFSDLSSGNTAGLMSQLLDNVTGSNLIKKSSIDGAPYSFEPNIFDNWILAVNQVVGTKNNIRVYKGKVGSFISQPYLNGQLGLLKQSVSPDIQYFNDLVGLVFLNNDDPCKVLLDPINVFLNIDDGSLATSSFCRLNIEQYLDDSQTSVSLATPSSLDFNAYVSYFDPQTQEIVESDIFSCEYCETIETQYEEEGLYKANTAGEGADHEIAYVLVHDLTGRLIFKLNGNAIPTPPKTGVYIISSIYKDGKITRKKMFLK